jgi:hypothetical protein
MSIHGLFLIGFPKDQDASGKQRAQTCQKNANAFVR